MSSFTVNLTPTLRNMATEGGLDTSITNNVSAQRSCYFEVYNDTSRKIVEADDGDTFDDTIADFTDNVDIAGS